MSNTAKIIADERDLIAAECQRLRNEYDKRCTELERRNRLLTAELDRWLTENRKHEKECDQLRAEVRQLQEHNAQQLAACDVAAMSDTEDSHAKAVCPKDSPFWSPAYESVMRRTAECIRLRAEVERLKASNMAWAIGIEQNSIDIVDMLRDEFRRIAALDVSDEVRGICQRAIETIEQKVPVIQQRDNAEERCNQWREVAKMLYRELADATPKQPADRIVPEHEQSWNALAAYERLCKEGK